MYRQFFPRAPAMPVVLLTLIAWLGGCASDRPAAKTASMNSTQARAFIEHAMPRGVADRKGWATDIYAAFTTLSIDPSRENACAVVAVISQESGFQVDPVIPGLGIIAWNEIDARAEHASIPKVLLHSVLQIKSSTGRSYAKRIDNARTEHELSDIYEDFIGRVPLGRTLFEDHNPIRTRGPMQVHVAFAAQTAAARPYPYPVTSSIDDELFTRRGGVYFGVAHLLAYQAPYDSYLYRFADFNAGQYASRNAAFQAAVATSAGIPLITDGALLPHDGEAKNAGSTEAALRALRVRLQLSDNAIHSALDKGKTREFEASALYSRVFGLADRTASHAAPRAVMPQIKLTGPKITRKLTTQWYAERVEGRFQNCLREN